MKREKLTISVREARTLLGLSTTTFWEVRKSDPSFPPPLKIPGAMRQYDRRSFYAWCKKVGITVEGAA